MSFKFGVSFNCYIGNGIEVGGCDIACDISYVSNDREKLIAHVIADNGGDQFKFTTDHEYVGESTNVGGSVLGVFIEDDEYIVAVLLSQPMTAEVV